LNLKKDANAFFAVALDLAALDGRLKRPYAKTRYRRFILKRRLKARFGTKYAALTSLNTAYENIGIYKNSSNRRAKGVGVNMRKGKRPQIFDKFTPEIRIGR